MARDVNNKVNQGLIQICTLFLSSECWFTDVNTLLKKYV